jgi:hypothetical protein
LVRFTDFSCQTIQNVDKLTILAHLMREIYRLICTPGRRNLVHIDERPSDRERNAVVLFEKDVKLVSRAALEALCAHQWAGSVASWGHAIECAVLMTENDRISLEDLPMHVSEGMGDAGRRSKLGPSR